jgi:hypothetical protein
MHNTPGNLPFQKYLVCPDFSNSTAKGLAHRSRQFSGALPVIVIWCGRRDLNPHAFRRHPLKMVCLPIPPLPPWSEVQKRRSARTTIIAKPPLRAGASVQCFFFFDGLTGASSASKKSAAIWATWVCMASRSTPGLSIKSCGNCFLPVSVPTSRKV